MPTPGWTRSRSGAASKQTPWPDTSWRSTTFSFRVEKAGERPLARQIREAQKIANETPGQLINGRNEHIPPAIRPLAPGHLLDNEAVRGEEGRGKMTITAELSEF